MTALRAILEKSCMHGAMQKGDQYSKSCVRCPSSARWWLLGQEYAVFEK